MQLGFVGLGKMGLNMVTRLVRGGHTVVAYDRERRRRRARRSRGREGRVDARGARRGAGRAARGLGDGAVRRSHRIDGHRARPRCCRPATRSSTAATPTSTTTCGARRRSRPSGIDYVDAGTSGGIWGLQEGYCLMVGGKADVCTRLEPIFLTLAPAGRLPARRRSRRRPLREDDPQRHRVRPDAGLRRRLRADARERLQDRSRRGRRRSGMHGSVVRSWLLELTARALAEDADLSGARRATSRTPAKDAGRCTRRSSAACRCRC